MIEPYFLKQGINSVSFWKNRRFILDHFDMELTERCNNNCAHCYINLPADDVLAKKKELSADEIKRILKEAVSLGCLTVRFTGGEPLLREDFEDLYIFARKLGLRVLLFTNATLITKHLAGLFSRIPALERIEVTVYGMKKLSYEGVTRAPGSFETAWKGMRLLLENNIPFVVKGALLISNKDEINEFEKWAATIPWMDESSSPLMFFNLRCRRDTGKNELIKKFRPSPEKLLKIITRKKDEYIKETKEFCSKFMGFAGDKLFSCGSGRGSGCVDAYGYFQPCMMLRHPDVVYDLKRGSFKDALVNFFPKLKELKATNPEYLRHCANCFLRGFCEQCPAKSWMEYGTLDTPVEYFCEVAHTQARYLGLLGKDEMGWEVSRWEERISRFVD